MDQILSLKGFWLEIAMIAKSDEYEERALKLDPGFGFNLERLALQDALLASKIFVMMELITNKRISSLDTAAKGRIRLGAGYDSWAMYTALDVANDYLTTGGRNTKNGTGLPYCDRIYAMAA